VDGDVHHAAFDPEDGGTITGDEGGSSAHL
jgi:hypothetical protein